MGLCEVMSVRNGGEMVAVCIVTSIVTCDFSGVEEERAWLHRLWWQPFLSQTRHERWF